MVLRVLGLAFFGAFCSVQASAADYCNSQDVPSSQVVVRVTSVLSTTCASGYRYSTEAPSDGRRVCATTIPFRLPSGWVATEGWSDASTCGGDASVVTTNQFTISAPRDGLWVCSNSAPAGFSVVETRQNNACAGRKTDSVPQYRLACTGSCGVASSSSSSSSSSSGHTYCDRNNVPLSEVIISAVSVPVSVCSSGYRYTSTVPTEGSQICRPQFRLPSGWVVTKSIVDSALCADDAPANWTNRYFISAVKDDLWICGPLAPAGYIFVESRSSDLCIGNTALPGTHYRITNGNVGKLLQHAGGLCVHPLLGSPNPDNGTKAILFPSCSSEDRLKYRLLPSGSIQHVSSGKCLHPEGGSPTPANGTKLVFWNSCNEDRLKFVYTQAGSLLHVSSGKCIHPEGNSATPTTDTALVLSSDCYDSRFKFNFL